jgi:hypothetical protein
MASSKRGALSGAALPCSLCTASTFLFDEDSARRYYRCSCCQLVLVDPQSWLTRDAEKRHYDFHQNDPRDTGYRQFLNRLFEPLHERLAPSCRGLDFGSGPGPTLSLMFAEAGHCMQIYDPFYAPDQSLLQRKYDFITASEVVEHLHQPGRELTRLWSLLEVGGWLGIMTKRVRSLEAFRSWHYKLDPTHVSFFSLETFAWLADRLAAHWLVVGDDVILFRKKCNHHSL